MKKYPSYVYGALRERLNMSREEVNSLSSDEIFKNFVAWNLDHASEWADEGAEVEWTELVKRWIKDVYEGKSILGFKRAHKALYDKIRRGRIVSFFLNFVNKIIFKEINNK